MEKTKAWTPREESKGRINWEVGTNTYTLTVYKADS